MASLTIEQVQSFLGMPEASAAADEVRLQSACDLVEKMAAGYCGREAFINQEYVAEFTVRDPWARAFILRARPIAPAPGIVCALADAGFIFRGADISSSVISASAHGLTTGDGPFRISILSGAIPTGLAVATDYYVVAPSADTIQLATSAALALAGSTVTVTAPGTGTHRLVGPVIKAPEIRGNLRSGIVHRAGNVPFPASDGRPLVFVFTGGLGTDHTTIPKDLNGALVKQAAWEYRKMGVAGQLTSQTTSVNGAVQESYRQEDWAPGVLAVLDTYKVRTLGVSA